MRGREPPRAGARSRDAAAPRASAGDDAQRAARARFARAGVATFVFARDAIGHDARGAPFVDYVRTWSSDVRVAADVFGHELWDAEEGVTAVVAVGGEDAGDGASWPSFARELGRAW